MEVTNIKKITVRIPADVADALHRAHLAAGGYGEKRRIVAEAVAAHPEVRDQLKGESRDDAEDRR